MGTFSIRLAWWCSWKGGKSGKNASSMWQEKDRKRGWGGDLDLRKMNFMEKVAVSYPRKVMKGEGEPKHLFI